MKRLNRLIASVGVLALLSTGASCIVAGCGGDDDYGGGVDGGTDATTDAPFDAITDRNTSDVNDAVSDVNRPDADAAIDAADAADAADANKPDGDAGADAADAKPDAADAADANDAADAADANDAADGADANDAADGADANDAADAADAADANIDAAEAGFDAQVLYDFRDEIATAYCGRWGFCCFGADAAAFDLEKCKQTQFNSFNTLGNVGHSVNTYDGGGVTLNAVAAQACRDDINPPTFTCTNVPTSYFTKINSDCSSAIQGLLPPAAVCHDFFECAGDQYCTSTRSDIDGTCVPIASAGQACTNAANYECAKNGFGAQYCTATSGNPNGTCQPLKAVGEQCASPIECASRSCPTNPVPRVCADTLPVFLSPVGCAAYTRDGG
jgi:hypothetical protein